MAGRRLEVRKAHMSRTEIFWQASNGDSRREFALIEDVSASGVGMRVHASVPVGTKLEFKFRDRMILGKVQHCTIDRLAYNIGISIDAEPATGLSQAKNR